MGKEIAAGTALAGVVIFANCDVYLLSPAMLLSQSKNVGFNRQLKTARHVWPVNIMDNWDMDINLIGGGWERLVFR